MEILQNPIVVALIALLAIPGVTSGITAVLRRIGAGGIDPRVVVYVASLVITGLVLLTTGAGLPPLGGDPSLAVGAWLTWLTVNAELSRRMYELFLSKVLPDPPAEPVPPMPVSRAGGP